MAGELVLATENTAEDWVEEEQEEEEVKLGGAASASAWRLTACCA
jgi:hypothetical protein